MSNYRYWKQFGLLFTTLLLVGAFLMATAQSSTQLMGNFVGTVRLGPDKGMVWKGVLRLTVATNGAVSGTLERPGGSTVKVTGTVIGQSISLVFDLGGGKYVFGTGGLNRDLRQKPSAMGGTLAGPNEGNIGDWGYGIGG